MDRRRGRRRGRVDQEDRREAIDLHRVEGIGRRRGAGGGRSRVEGIGRSRVVGTVADRSQGEGMGGGPQPGGGGRPQPPRPQPRPPNPGNRPGPGYRPPPRPGRPPQWGRPPQNRPTFHFRPSDRDFLRRYYLRHLAYINLGRRPVFTVGGYFPFGDIGYLTPVPAHLWSSLPPIPPGYQAGYFDGYVVIYDPLTYYIADTIDLVQ